MPGERGRQTRREDGKPYAGGPGRLTHAERVIDPASGLTKGDLARYYTQAAPLMRPYLKGGRSRWCARRRASGDLFFQRHMDAAMPGARLLPESLYPGHPPLLELPTPRAVLAAVQMNAIEFHTWNAVKTTIDKPDRIVFDLDPARACPGRASGRRPGCCARC